MTTTTKKTRDRLQGKIATLLNERELVINIGKSDGVRTGMKFKILSESPVEIHDPETGELLGIVDREKVRVQAVDVKEKFSVCSTYRAYHTGGGPLYSISAYRLMSNVLTAPPRKVVETLKAENSEYLPPLSEEESYVKRGDRVIELFEGED